MNSRVLQMRRQKQREQIARARAYVDGLRPFTGPLSAWLYGSVARGTFKDWSDVDVLVVAELPTSPHQRSELLYAAHLPGVEPKGWTREEFERFVVRRDPQLLAMLTDRIVLADDLGLESGLPQSRALPGETED